jgi:flagellar biosynthesis/type III secretory pathway chaperone
MDRLFSDLVAILRQEITHYRSLLGLVRRERARIVKGELTALAGIVREKEVLTRELAQLEKSRASVLDRLASEMGEPTDILPLAHIARIAPSELGETLTALLEEFRGVIGRLVTASDVNRNLLDGCLEVVQGSLDLFRTVASANATYGASGQLNAPHPTLIALNQTA